MINKHLRSTSLRILTGKIHPQLKTEVLTKSMNMFILGIGTVNQLFVEVLILKLCFQKNEIVSDKKFIL